MGFICYSVESYLKRSDKKILNQRKNGEMMTDYFFDSLSSLKEKEKKNAFLAQKRIVVTGVTAPGADNLARYPRPGAVDAYTQTRLSIAPTVTCRNFVISESLFSGARARARARVARSV